MAQFDLRHYSGKLRVMTEDVAASRADDREYETYWDEVVELLEGEASQFRRAVELCLENDLWEPALVLMLSFVDACSWMSRPQDHNDVRQADFLAWVDTYLLPESKLVCTAEDLYGARCGLLHSLTGESRLHRQNRVRKIFWSRTIDGETYTLIQVRMAETLEPIAVDIDHLFWAIQRALDRFSETMMSTDDLRRSISERVYKSYFTKARRLR